MIINLGFVPNKSGEYIIDVGYGFGAHYVECTAKEPGRPVENYRLHRSITPGQIKKLVHEKTGREFRFENQTGFICYKTDMVEVLTGRKVATIKHEEYYKD